MIRVCDKLTLNKTGNFMWLYLEVLLKCGAFETMYNNQHMKFFVIKNQDKERKDMKKFGMK